MFASETFNVDSEEEEGCRISEFRLSLKAVGLYLADHSQLKIITKSSLSN